MAAKESPDIGRTDMESVVNRWIVDYYLSLALKAFDREQSENFRKIKNVLESVLARPVEYSDKMLLKLSVFQLLSCINDSERLDVSGESAAPLERALMLLQGMRQDCSLPQQEMENMCTSVKEMLVVILIKANKFDKAKEVLTMHFPNPMVGKKAIFMGLISQRSTAHEVIQQSDFVQFKKETSAFCQKLCPFVVPFLHKAAKQLIDSRVAEPECNAARPDEQEEPGSSSQINTIPCLSSKHKIMQRTRLEAAYKMLYSQAEMRTFAQLEEEVEREEQERTDDLILRLSPSVMEGCSQESEPDEVFQRGSGSPMEASVADHPSQTDAVPDTQAGSITSPPPGTGELYTVARLVVEPDSLSSSQCTVASQEADVEVLEVESPQSPTVASKSAVQSPLSDNIKPSMNPPNRHRRRASTRSVVLSIDSEEDLPASEADQECFVLETQNESNSSLSNSPKSQGGVQSLDERIEDREDSPTDEDPRSATFRTPERAKKSRSSGSKQNGIEYDTDSSLDSSPGVALPRQPLPQTSSTPDAARNKNHSKWKQLYSNAKESKETWSDEETNFPSHKNRLHDSSISVSGHRKRKWTEHETKMLIEGVRKYGEGNWTKIKTNYGFSGRTNINLKDRWRTLKKLNHN